MSHPLRCIITGATQGIGGAIAARFRRDGHQVVGLDIETTHAPVPIIQVDLSDSAVREQAFSEATQTLGGVDVLVNAAGIFRQGSILDSTEADWAELWHIALTAPLDLMRLAAQPMVAAGFGRIVNITSVHATHGQPGCLAYDVAKAGLEAATRSAAIDLADHGVLVNAIAPGFVRTRMSLRPDGTDETDSASFRSIYGASKKLPLARAASPEEIATAAVFLSSVDTTYITGQVLTVDGGLTATF